MPRFEDVKPRDLIITKYVAGGIHSQAVVIGLPTEESYSGGHLGLNPSKIAPGIMCYKRIKNSYDTGFFLTLNQDHWANGAEKDYYQWRRIRN